MKRCVRYLCVAAFLLLCASAFIYLNQFTVPSEAPMRYMVWEDSVLVYSDGTEEPFSTEEYDAALGMPEGALCRFTTTLPADVSDGYMVFETTGLDITVLLGGEIFYRSDMPYTENVYGSSQAHLVLPDDAAGKTLTALCRPTAEFAMFPPLMRYTSDTLLEGDTIAYANLIGIPAGVYGLAFVLIGGLFLLGLARKRTDYSLIPLILATLLLMLRPISVSCGYYFLPLWLTSILAWKGFTIVIVALLGAYLAMNRRREFWRFFGWSALGSAVTLGILYLISLWQNTYLSQYINGEIQYLFTYGDYTGILTWLTLWMVVACAVISTHALVRSLAKAQADTKTYEMREHLAMENYRAVEQKLRETAAVRHETEHQFATLNVLAESGDIEALKRELAKFVKQNSDRQPVIFTPNIVINAVLQNTAAEAAEAAIAFKATALTPETLTLPESDLCTFLMNMLDNALEAARAVPDSEKRFIRFRAESSGNFLILHCENSYAGSLKLDEKGLPQTAKPEPELHGFGIKKMKQIAEQYGSILDISYTDDVFTVQSALCLLKI